MPNFPRIIGHYGGQLPGALVFAFAALHGNEPAGVQALEVLFGLLENSALSGTSGGVFRGKIVGLLGNRWAYSAKKRFIEKDLNRQWTPENIARLNGADPAGHHAEDREMAELLALMHAEIVAYQPEAILLLDLHTTSAGGGIFCLPANDPVSLRLAKDLASPVVLGLEESLAGTLLHFAASAHIVFNTQPCPVFGVGFEAGQHDDPLSVNRSIAVAINCLRSAGCIDADALPTQHEAILHQYAAPLPKVTRLRYTHAIRPSDHFRMRPGYANFQPVHRSEHLADDVRGPIFAPDNGLLLMPLYQPQGSDGFFIVQEIKG